MFGKKLAMVMVAGLAVLPLAASAGDAGGEITNAATHAGLAATATDVAGVHMHLHHTINCLVGPGGTGFDAKELNPCANSGNGAIPDSTNPTTKQALQGAVAQANTGLAATDLATAQKDASTTEAMLKAVK
jgi:hypothetical protein